MEIYLAGCEAGDKPLNTVIGEDRIENGFISYYYMRTRKSKKSIQFYREHIQNIIIDSGAHSFFGEQDQFETASVVKRSIKTKVSPADYMNQYFEWLDLNRNSFEYFVELDIGEIVGQETVERWRLGLKERGLMDQAITVYHPAVMSWEDYIALLDASESRYIALEGLRGGKSPIPYLKCIREAHRRGVRVHGFAMVKDNLMLRYPFTSVDSVSWKAGNIWGIVAVPDEDSRVRMAKPRHGLRQAMEAAEFVGPNGINQKTKEDRFHYQYRVLCAGIIGVERRQEFFSSLWKRRGVTWPTPKRK